MNTEKVENLVRLAIVAVVGLAAGAASFTHVHDWTMANSPAGTPGWFGWANAVISELVPIAALLTIRSNRRNGKSIGFPVAMLIGAAGFSLAAQLAVAKPSASGWLLSAVPAVAFMLLVKLVLAGLPNADQQATPVPIPAAVPIGTLPTPLPIPCPSEPVKPVWWDVVPIGTQTLPIVPIRQTPGQKPADRQISKRTSKQRKPVVPAHTEKSYAEIAERAEKLKPEFGTWEKVAAEIGISVRKLQDIRKAVAA